MIVLVKNQLFFGPLKCAARAFPQLKWLLTCIKMIFNIGTELRMLFGDTIRKNILRNKKMYDRVELLKPTINEMKKLSKKIISNIGPKF